MSFRSRGAIVLIAYSLFLAAAFWRAGRDAPAPKRAGGPAAMATREGAIAVVDIKGAIGMGGSYREGSAAGALKRLRELKNQSDVKAVLLRIDSPGGSVGSVQELYEAILAVKGSGKKVVAAVGDVAASGGYYAACAADRIVANPGSLVGSIGVIFHLLNAEDLAKKIGVRSMAIKSGALKDMGSPYRDLTPEERAVFQGLVQSAYGQFVKAVADGRKLSPEKVKPLADGRVFTGEQAHSLGMVDVLGGYDTAIKEAAQLAGIKSANPRIVENEKPWEKWLGALGSAYEGPLAEFRRRFSATPSLLYVWE